MGLVNSTYLDQANKLASGFGRLFKHQDIKSIASFDIVEAPFEDENEVGIEINFEELFINLVIKDKELYMLEIEVMYKELYGKGIATSAIRTLKNIAIELGMITFEITGIHNKVVYNIGEKLGLTRTENRSLILKIKERL